MKSRRLMGTSAGDLSVPQWAHRKLPCAAPELIAEWPSWVNMSRHGGAMARPVTSATDIFEECRHGR
jgi:hypothetical protein